MTGEEPQTISSIIGAVAELKSLPKVFRKLCFVEVRYPQNLTRV
jgi:hypothetical protein